MPDSDRGFTLLELLISLTIVAIILVLIFGALRIGIRAWEKGEAGIETHQRRRIVLDLIRRQLVSIVLRKIKEGGKEPFFLKGDDKSMEFVSNMSMVPGNSFGMVYVKYIIQIDDEVSKEDSSEKERLLFYEKNLVLIKKDEDISEADEDLFYELIPRAESIIFEYLGNTDQEPLEWQQIWDPEVEKRFPVAVRISVKEKSGSAPIYVIVRLSADALS